MRRQISRQRRQTDVNESRPDRNRGTAAIQEAGREKRVLMRGAIGNVESQNKCTWYSHW